VIDRHVGKLRGAAGRFGLVVLGLALLLASAPARGADCVRDYGGVIDGFVDPTPPSQIQIDGNCTIRNFPASNPLTSNISFFTQPGQNPDRWLIIFDNVVHTGQMACNSVQGHKIWFTNGSSSAIKDSCQNQLIPVEKIDKANPPGPPTVTVGIPFTYTLTIPVLFDPATSTVINYSGSPNDLHGITIWDDLNETGVDLRYVSHRAFWPDDGSAIPHSFTNAGGLLTFDDFVFNGDTVLPREQQFVIEITVVLEDTPTNSSGTEFINTAKWDFGRLIDGIYYEPLPGEWGVTSPLTIAAPELVVTKSGPATMNLGEWGEFVVDVENVGLSGAWDVSLRDLLPDGADGGMCDLAPEILSARVFAADGVTPVAGKGPLEQGVDYTLSFSPAPDCRLDLTMLSSAGTIGPGERLVIRYRTQLDADTQDGVELTNVVGAVQWFNGDAANPERIPYTRTLDSGSVGIPDHEDAHTVTTALTGFFFEKTAANVTTGADPTATAAPGDTLRYTLRFRSTDEGLGDFRILDELDRLNDPPVFAPGTLTLISYPAGADVSNTSSTGGSAGTGVVDIRGLSVAADGEIVIQFEIRLADSLGNGTVATNQSSLLLADGSTFALSDDPTVNGVASPEVAGDEDPTRVTIVAAPVFTVEKISTDLGGDPDVLLAGETLRYTITVRNVGNEDAVDVVLRDAVPLNTAYVAGSTTLNGATVADVGGTSPLAGGMSINSPSDPAPGFMPADASGSPENAATITFDVVIDPDVLDGTVISNQGFLSAVGQGIVDQPSDDPGTPIADDPTLDIVGNLPLLYAEKSVELLEDLGSPGIVDPGDTLRYTITVQNSAAIPATGVVLTDAVPANTTYVADSTLLNGLPVGQPDGGASPLASGVDISSSDLTPPLPGPGGGEISPGQAAELQFDLRVDDGTPAGTLISNQAVVTSAELEDLLTDGDGDPTTGPEPTVVVVGDVQQLSITKQVAVVGGGAALAGAELEYVVTVLNIGSVPAVEVVLTDDLDAPVAGQLLYVASSATLNGSSAGVSVAGSTITADYEAAYGSLEPGATAVLRFRATLAGALAEGTVVTNTGVVTWNVPAQSLDASVSLTVGGIPGAAALGGTAWHDADFDDTRDAGERPLAGWSVELYRDGVLVHTALTDADGSYRIVGVEPNEAGGAAYELRFLAPGASASTARLGLASSPFTNGLQRIGDVVVPPDANVQGLDLPIDPNGVVYDSVARIPVAGATLTLLDAGSSTPLPAGCFDDAAQQGQVTLANGYYKFDLNFDDPACPSGADFVVDVTVPAGTRYIAGTSQIIPPASDGSTSAFQVPDCPGSGVDAIAATAGHCEIQTSEFAPAASVAPRSPGTTYHLHLNLDDSGSPGTSQAFNNHIPIDQELGGAIALSKTTPLRNVSRGQLVPYVITVNNVAGFLLSDVSIVDSFPAGFSYVEGSARLDGVPSEPTIDGRELRWDGLIIAGTEVRTLKLLLAVGAGVSEGKFVNRALIVNGTTGEAMSGEASATVRVVADPTFDCSDVIGKVFDDANRNGVQDEGEEGLSGVRLATLRGLEVTTDRHGRYHITCAITPNEFRGSNFVLKLDDRTLPSGYRMSTDKLQVRRATRGKLLRIDFGASIHRVVAIDLSDAAFEPGSTEIRIQWRSRIGLLLEELRKAPSVLRLSYVADTEEAGLVNRRVDAFKRRIADAWGEQSDYALTIEPEIFWRLGGPPGRPDVPGRGAR
jgi:uncharacterized repeat protein (TIGR01451 family)